MYLPDTTDNFDPVGHASEASGSAAFWVHADFICKRSIFFRRSLSAQGGDVDNKLLCLPNEDPDIFKAYLALLYSGDAFVKLKEKDFRPSRDEDVHAMCQLYILAEKLEDTVSKNMIVELMIPEAQFLVAQLAVGDETISLVYKRTSKSCPFRRLILHAHVDCSLSLHEYPYPSEFLFDLAKLLMGEVAYVETDWLGSASDYYCEDSECEDSEAEQEDWIHFRPLSGIAKRHFEASTPGGI